MAVWDWSTTAANNATADSNINWAEGQAPSTVNDSSRAEMARLAHFFNWCAANVTSGGSSNAYTYTSGENLSAYSNNMRFAWSPNADSTGAVTINVDTIGAKKVYMPDGTQAGNGDLDADSLYDIVYDSSLDSAAGAFKIVGFPDTTLTAADYLTVANNLSDVANAATARSNLGAYGASDNVSFGTITATGDVAIDTDTLFVDVSADRVGINVAAPGNALHVQSESGEGIIRMTSANGTYDYVWACTSGGNFYLNDVNTGSLPFVVELGAGSNTLRVDSNSRVGIGTASPSVELEVNGAAKANTIDAHTPVGGVSTGTLDATNLGHGTNLSGNITIPSTIGAAQQTIGPLNSGGASRTITRGSGLSMYVNGTNVASCTLAARGLAVIWFQSATICYVLGDVS